MRVKLTLREAALQNRCSVRQGYDPRSEHTQKTTRAVFLASSDDQVERAGNDSLVPRLPLLRSHNVLRMTFDPTEKSGVGLFSVGSKVILNTLCARRRGSLGTRLGNE